MERIKLSKREKHVLRTLATSDFDRLSEFDHSAVSHLHELGLVHALFEEGGTPVAATLTTKGKEYLHGNPHLHNPVNWAAVAAISSIATLIVAIIGLLIACSKLS